MEYTPSLFEVPIKEFWDQNEIYKVTNDSTREKYYVLDMFPYPSGAGLHVGHPLGYIASDIYARFKRLKGYNVLHPMGYDAFGLPAEQYAIQTGVHPHVSTLANIATFKLQLEKIGFSFDWSRELKTCDPQYYKWTQWIFVQLYNHYYDKARDKAMPIQELEAHFERFGTDGLVASETNVLKFDSDQWSKYSRKEKSDVLMNYRLVYQSVGYVNWCEELGTVLANDEIKDGVSERGGFAVTKKAMLQWSLRTTAYAQRLLDDLRELAWSEPLKTMQTNWIGRSEGAIMEFSMEGFDFKIPLYTTRPDTIFGATFVVLAPEHDLVPLILSDSQKTSVEQYIEGVKSKSERDRTEGKNVSGVFTGAYAKHPFLDKLLPIWIADYVLKDYGTGAIMAVPAHDDRDYAFATHFEMEIITVIDQSNFAESSRQDKVGKMINSGFLDGQNVLDAIKVAIQKLTENGVGRSKINYRLRDANYSRQRYWGEPFPIYFDQEGVPNILDINDPQCQLPNVTDYRPSKGQKAPLNNNLEWVHFEKGKTMETDTMPGFAGSSWYFLRYMDPNNDSEPFSQEAVQYWKEVDLYIGGSEHAVGHLLYSRMWHKFLFDLGFVPTKEPFKKLINQGMIQGVSAKIWMLKENFPEDYFSLLKQNGFSFLGDSKAQVFLSTEAYGFLIENGHKVNAVLVPFPLEFVGGSEANIPICDEVGFGKFAKWRRMPMCMVLKNQRALLVSEVEKMSKSKYNVVNPDDIVAKYGADCFRLYEMFLGPIEQAKPWDTNGIDGVSKFLRKYWNLFFNEQGMIVLDTSQPSSEELKTLHTCLRKVNEDIERFGFNTCVSAFMICVNELRRIGSLNKEILSSLTIALAPFAPFITEYIWINVLQQAGSVHKLNDMEPQRYPSFDEQWLVSDSIDYPVCINGKKRAILTVSASLDIKSIESEALALEEITKWIEGPIKKVIVIPSKMVNIVL